MTNSSDSPASGLHGYIIDTENAAEMARLMLQDRMLTRALGGLVPEPIDLSKASQVLDIACGPGGWLLDLATHYPHIYGVGIDISQLMIEYAASQAASMMLPNAQFHVMDVTKSLDFPDASFDLVNARVLTSFLAKERWPALLQECFRITRPGGILRLTEAEWGATNSPAYEKFTSFAALGNWRAGHSFSPFGRTFGTPPVLRLLMRQAGYQHIQHRACAVDYSVGTEDYESGIQNYLVFHKLVQPFLVQMQVATEEELQDVYAQLEEEMQAEDFCAFDYYLTVWGKRQN
ncbi:MAG TPA: methyltransferase domain-containing protein [Ktedonobacteraceae bacterium]|jgi:ubiquinone/menaquinone biosynthesis C-methylase UbiE